MFAKKTEEELKRLRKQLRKQNKSEDIPYTDMYYRDIYGNLERTFYAFMIDKLPQIHDMWDLNSDKRRKSLIKAGYTYFFINTMVGVGSKTHKKEEKEKDEKIERVHIRFAMTPMHQRVPEPEIILIYPNHISKVIGEIASRRDTESGRRYGIEGKGSGGVTSSSFQLRLTGLLNFFKSTSTSKKITTTLPNEILITNASGCGNHAIWEFYGGEGIQDVGEYNLEIIFRIPRCVDNIKFGKGWYCINWNIEVNGRMLMDHEYDLNNDKWNMTVNGMKLMDHTDGSHKHTWNTRQEGFHNIIMREYPNIDTILLRPVCLVKSVENDSMDTFSFMQT